MKRDMNDTKVIELYSGPLWDCQILQSLLSNADIKSFIRNDLRSTYAALMGSSQYPRVMILESDLEKGTEVLKQFNNSTEVVDESDSEVIEE